MSSADLEAEAAADMMCCASCGIAEGDDIKLKKCTGCKSVRYCGVECQKNHRPKHKKACKKRAAELRDELLFKQPESTYFGDCPICLLPLPLDIKKSVLQSCCCKIICKGCQYVSDLRAWEQKQDVTCAFCRHPDPTPETHEEARLNIMKRVAVNDPVAIRELGSRHYTKGEYGTAFEYYTKAAELGDGMAHFQLSVAYRKGEGVEKDEKKEIYHLEVAAIAGYPSARCNLGLIEGRKGRVERAVKHFVIAANHGHDDSIEMLREFYVGEAITKEEFAAALRAHQAFVDATKSPQREAAAEDEVKATLISQGRVAAGVPSHPNSHPFIIRM